MLKVYIPARVLKGDWSGVQYYTAQLIAALSRRSDIDLTVNCRKEAAQRLEQLTEGRVKLEVGGGDCRGHDIIHWPTVHVPTAGRPRGKSGGRVVMTFHDLVPLVMPHTHMWHYRMYFRWALPYIARWLDAVIAVSESTACDVHEHYRVKRDRIVVTGQGCRYEDATAVVDASKRERFILAVGTREPRKNLTRVIEAFLSLDDPDTKLVIAGGRGWGDDQKREYGDKVQWLGYVGSDELKSLYQRAAVVAYPSLYEGFGLPVLEAMTLGCPVITSNVSSLPEVAGDAAILVDPQSESAIADAIRRMLDDISLRDDLARRGVDRAKCFTWELCAAKTVACYESVLSR
jgi:glycosyltransferase involved in cell wall biosynthesis